MSEAPFRFTAPPKYADGKRSNYRIHADQFSVRANNLAELVIYLTELYHQQGRAGQRGKILLPNGQMASKGELNSLRSALITELRKLPLYFRASASSASRARGGVVAPREERPQTFFMISNRLRDYLLAVTAASGIQLGDSFQNVIGNNVASSPILMSLMSTIIRQLNLQSVSNPLRVHYDKLMNDHFGAPINWEVAGSDLHASFNPQSNWPQFREPKRKENELSRSEKMRRIWQAISDGKTGFQLLSEEGDVKMKSSDRVMPYFIEYAPGLESDDWGFLRIGLLKLLNYYHIPSEFLDEKTKGFIETYRAAADEVLARLKDLGKESKAAAPRPRQSRTSSPRGGRRGGRGGRIGGIRAGRGGAAAAPVSSQGEDGPVILPSSSA